MTLHLENGVCSKALWCFISFFNFNFDGPDENAGFPLDVGDWMGCSGGRMAGGGQPGGRNGRTAGRIGGRVRLWRVAGVWRADGRADSDDRDGPGRSVGEQTGRGWAGERTTDWTACAKNILWPAPLMRCVKYARNRPGGLFLLTGPLGRPVYVSPTTLHYILEFNTWLIVFIQLYVLDQSNNKTNRT